MVAIRDEAWGRSAPAGCLVQFKGGLPSSRGNWLPWMCSVPGSLDCRCRREADLGKFRGSAGDSGAAGALEDDASACTARGRERGAHSQRDQFLVSARGGARDPSHFRPISPSPNATPRSSFHPSGSQTLDEDSAAAGGACRPRGSAAVAFSPVSRLTQVAQ